MVGDDELRCTPALADRAEVDGLLQYSFCFVQITHAADHDAWSFAGLDNRERNGSSALMLAVAVEPLDP